MAPRVKAAQFAKTSKTSKRKPRATSTSADDSDSEVAVSKRRRGRILSSKTIIHCVIKPSIKVTRSMKTDVPDVVVPQREKPKEPKEVPYWQRRRPLNSNIPYKEPTAKQLAAVAADWSEGQRDPRFPEFEQYDLVIQDPTEKDVITRLSEEPHKRMGDLQFLMQTRYEDPIDEARDYHEMLFVFKYDMPPDKERRYPQSAAVKTGQIRVSHVWALSEVTGRQGAREKCWMDEAMLLKLVMRQAGLANVSLEEWRAEMELRQLRPCYANPGTTSWRHRRASNRAYLADVDANPRSVRNEAATLSVLCAKRSALIDLDAIESNMRPPAKKARTTPGCSLPSARTQPNPAKTATPTSLISSPAISARPTSLMGPPPRPIVILNTALASTEPSSTAHVQDSLMKTLTEAEVARIAVSFCIGVNDEVQLHFAVCTKYKMNTVQQAIRQFVSIIAPASQSYMKEQWQQVISNHLTFQQKCLERKWCEGNPGSTFKPVSKNPLARQLSCFIADYATRYPHTQGVPEAQAQRFGVALQRAAMRKQRGLLVSWTTYWEGAVQTRCGAMAKQGTNKAQQSASPRPVPSIPGCQVDLIKTADDRASLPARLSHKRKCADGTEPVGAEHFRPTKKARPTEHETPGSTQSCKSSP